MTAVIQVTLAYCDSDPEIRSWCEATIGRCARDSRHVGTVYPWYQANRFAHAVYYFAHERDAFLFRLRWL